MKCWSKRCLLSQCQRGHWWQQLLMPDLWPQARQKINGFGVRQSAFVVLPFTGKWKQFQNLLHISYGESRDDNSSYLTRLQWGFKEQTHGKHLEQCPEERAQELQLSLVSRVYAVLYLSRQIPLKHCNLVSAIGRPKSMSIFILQAKKNKYKRWNVPLHLWICHCDWFNKEAEWPIVR